MKKFTKKILAAFSLFIVAFSFLTALLPATTAYADNAYFTGRSGNSCQGFLGLVSWDCGVNISNENSLKTGIWQIVANVATDITIIAAYLILIYVIYGGYLYLLSSGDGEKTSKGKKTLTHAFIGLAIVLAASLVMNTIRIVLISESGQFTDCINSSMINNPTDNNTSPCVEPGTMVIGVINWFIGISGLVAVIFLIYGGITYITSAGEPAKITRAKETILYSIIGLIIIALAATITAFVSSSIRNATDVSEEAAIVKNLSTIKEVHETKTC